jgi:hypothetical protein
MSQGIGDKVKQLFMAEADADACILDLLARRL